MLASVDQFLTRRRRRRRYDCRHFLREVWMAHTGEDLLERLPVLFGERPTVLANEIREVRRLRVPSDPCVVVFKRGLERHVGMFLRGNVLHLPGATPRFERIDIAMIGFQSVRYYR
jgi:hypothetical protein